jgi:hypothetical protein
MPFLYLPECLEPRQCNYDWQRRVRLTAAAKISCAALVAVSTAAGTLPAAAAAFQVTSFSLTPSTTKAGARASIAVSASFLGADNTAQIKDIALHLPVGFRARPRAAAYCSPKKLVRNDCPDRSKVGAVAVTGSAFGTSATVRRDIYNMAPARGEFARLGAVALPGITISLPLIRRPDGRIDLGVTGIPRIGGPAVVQLDRIEARFKGKVGRRTLLTLPRSCVPATTTLDVGFHDDAQSPVTASSTFTPTGC